MAICIKNKRSSDLRLMVQYKYLYIFFVVFRQKNIIMIFDIGKAQQQSTHHRDTTYTLLTITANVITVCYIAQLGCRIQTTTATTAIIATESRFFHSNTTVIKKQTWWKKSGFIIVTVLKLLVFWGLSSINLLVNSISTSSVWLLVHDHF